MPVFAVLLALLLCIPVITGCAGAEPSGPVLQDVPDTVCEIEPQTATEPETGLSPSERVPRITVEELLQKIEQNDPVLIIDIRRDIVTSFEKGHIKGAVAVPFMQIIERQWVVPEDKDIEVVLYCS